MLLDELQSASKPNAILTTEIHGPQGGPGLPVEIAVRFLRVDDDRFAILAARDITERRKSEEQIFKLNRLYAVISQVNKAIVKVRNRESLFDEICRLCVDRGRFQVARIGMLQGRQLHDAASATEPAYANCNCSVVPGPCLDAALQGRHFVCNELSADTSRAGCQKMVATKGLGSACVLPLKIKGEPVGMLTLYSGEPHFFDEQEMELLEGVSSDISFALETFEREEHRKRMEHAAAENRHQLEAMFETSPIAIVAIDVEDRVTIWNKAACNIFGWSQEEVIGKPLPTVPPSAQAEHKDLLRRTRIVNVELKRQRKDGTLIDVILSGAPLLNAEGQLIGYLAMYADITERKQLQSELLQAQKLESIGHLAGGIAHDFNNLLAVISGHSELALNILPPHNPASLNVREIQKASQGGADLTRQLLAFGRKQVLQPRIVSVNAVIEDMKSMLRSLTGERINLVTALEQTLGGIKSDPGQLQQVLMNLVVNARDAITQSGTVTIATRDVRIDSTDASGIAPGDYVTLSVSDTGIGMDEATQSQIFEPFFTTKGVGKGTGLGLSTVWGIVKQSGGYIRVKSTLGQGSIFVLYWPRQEQSVREDFEQDIPTSLHGSETLLVVEDQTDLRELLVEILKGFGYRVLKAATPAEALRTWREMGHDLSMVITDVVMPGMSGPELVQKLRALQPGIKVLYMSGHASDTVLSKETLLEEVFLEKPFSAIKLATTVRRVLGTGPRVPVICYSRSS